MLATRYAVACFLQALFFSDDWRVDHLQNAGFPIVSVGGAGGTFEM